jgi:thiamine-monophosphate kinase
VDTTVAGLGEHALIDRIRSRLPTRPDVIVGPGDDAAVVAPPRGMLDVFTTDAQVEGVHFDLRFVPPRAIGHRALAVNLSDLAAMGAEPRVALLSLILPDRLEIAMVDGLVTGLLSLAAAHRVAIVGGNIARSPGPLVVDVTAVGAVRSRCVLTRRGARPGDDVFVTGTLGAATVGLQRLQRTHDAFPGSEDADARYLTPEPRVRAGLLLGRNRVASSCIDLSDGLADAVRQLATASHVGMVLDSTALPVAAAARAWHDRHGGDPVATAVRGGEDYELLFTVRANRRGRLRGVRQQLGDLPITRIGVVTRGTDLLIATREGTSPLPSGFEHFR